MSELSARARKLYFPLFFLSLLSVMKTLNCLLPNALLLCCCCVFVAVLLLLLCFCCLFFVVVAAATVVFFQSFRW